MKLTCVTVSVNYSDYLEYTIKNKSLFDEWIIITDTKDLKTKELCDKYGVKCIQTDVFYENGALFNKYAAINEGLKLVGKDEWILFLDSDILLHPQTKRMLEVLKLKEDCLYGMDRLNLKGIEDLQKYNETPGMLKDNWLLHSQGFELGARLVHHYGHEGENGRFEGWRPLGFFQLAHHNYFETYPDNSIGADANDLVFARQWPRHKRVFIPEIFCLHLETKGAGKAINWYGRKSAPFNPQPEIIPSNEIAKEEEENKKHKHDNEWWEWVWRHIIHCFRWHHHRKHHHHHKHHHYYD